MVLPVKEVASRMRTLAERYGEGGRSGLLEVAEVADRLAATTLAAMGVLAKAGQLSAAEPGEARRASASWWRSLPSPGRAGRRAEARHREEWLAFRRAFEPAWRELIPALERGVGELRAAAKAENHRHGQAARGRELRPRGPELAHAMAAVERCDALLAALRPPPSGSGLRGPRSLALAGVLAAWLASFGLTLWWPQGSYLILLATAPFLGLLAWGYSAGGAGLPRPLRPGTGLMAGLVGGVVLVTTTSGGVLAYHEVFGERAVAEVVSTTVEREGRYHDRPTGRNYGVVEVGTGRDLGRMSFGPHERAQVRDRLEISVDGFGAADPVSADRLRTLSPHTALIVGGVAALTLLLLATARAEARHHRIADAGAPPD
ncbi:hypothetical protein [Streptomyces profundus]|uniref:hypothetical protein n=1 Tax=Streptomyces profundus TaxID=2867410 RepID=UPI001D15E5D6|nr:hypothetical protein [Streptomyces sp. MA3_2.13]UED87140.1 hypothetical protein K4G22_25460 [Streptomyces sp. MA3_2.13]